MKKGTVEAIVFLNLMRYNDQLRRMEVLLHLRQGTGELDGYWTLACGGHVEPEELELDQAMIREAKEEINLDLREYKRFRRVDAFLARPRDRWNYLVVIYELIVDMKVKVQRMEPERCAELRWFGLEDLPKNLDDQVTFVLENLSNWQKYRSTL